MKGPYLREYLSNFKDKSGNISLDIEKLLKDGGCGKSGYKLAFVPLYAVLYLLFTEKAEFDGVSKFLESISKYITSHNIDFFLSDSKGKSPLLFFANCQMIMVFNKVCTMLSINSFKVFSVEQIAKFNFSANIVLFGILLFTLGKYLSSRSVQRKIVLLVQVFLFYFFKNQFLEQKSQGMINADLVFNNLATGALFHLNQFHSSKVSDLKNVLITSFLLGALISTKPVLATSALVYLWLLFYWVWQIVSFYQFDISFTSVELFLYQFVVKVGSMIAVPLFVYLKLFSILIRNFDYNENNFDFKQLSPLSQITFNSLKNAHGDMIGVPKNIRFMDTVLIRHKDSLGGYLHSHDATLHTGSGQQQVTVFDSQDMMNEWVILPGNKQLRVAYLSGNNTDYDVVERSQTVLLKHKITQKYLYVHPDFRGPVSEKEKAHEITCKEFDPILDDDSNFIFRIDYSFKRDHSDLQLIDNDFELTSISVAGCKLISHPDRLPPWGFFQQEVICMEQANSQKSQFDIEKIVETTTESLGKVEFRYVNNLSLLQLLKEYIIKSWKKEVYDDDLKRKIDAHHDKLVLLPVKEAIFKFNTLSMLHSFTIGTIVLTLLYILYVFIQIAPFAENVNWFKNVGNLKAKQFRYLPNSVSLLLGLAMFSLSLIKLNEYCCLTETIYQFGLTLQVLLIAEYVNCFV